MAELATHHHPAQASTVVLVVDDDADIADLVDEFLTSEGYTVALLRDRDLESVQDVVQRLRPDCVLLDGYVRGGGYDTSWTEAAWMASQDPAVPVIMFSADRQATCEAQRRESRRSHAAGFSSVLVKPFDLDELVRVVTLAVSPSPFRA